MSTPPPCRFYHSRRAGGGCREGLSCRFSHDDGIVDGKDGNDSAIVGGRSGTNAGLTKSRDEFAHALNRSRRAMGGDGPIVGGGRGRGRGGEQGRGRGRGRGREIDGRRVDGRFPPDATNAAAVPPSPPHCVLGPSCTIPGCRLDHRRGVDPHCRCGRYRGIGRGSDDADVDYDHDADHDKDDDNDAHVDHGGAFEPKAASRSQSAKVAKSERLRRFPPKSDAASVSSSISSSSLSLLSSSLKSPAHPTLPGDAGGAMRIGSGSAGPRRRYQHRHHDHDRDRPFANDKRRNDAEHWENTNGGVKEKKDDVEDMTGVAFGAANVIGQTPGRKNYQRNGCESDEKGRGGGDGGDCDGGGKDENRRRGENATPEKVKGGGKHANETGGGPRNRIGTNKQSNTMDEDRVCSREQTRRTKMRPCRCGPCCNVAGCRFDHGDRGGGNPDADTEVCIGPMLGVVQGGESKHEGKDQKRRGVSRKAANGTNRDAVAEVCIGPMLGVVQGGERKHEGEDRKRRGVSRKAANAAKRDADAEVCIGPMLGVVQGGESKHEDSKRHGVSRKAANAVKRDADAEVCIGPMLGVVHGGESKHEDSKRHGVSRKAANAVKRDAVAEVCIGPMLGVVQGGESKHEDSKRHGVPRNAVAGGSSGGSVGLGKPCRYGSRCVRKNCRFRHTLAWDARERRWSKFQSDDGTAGVSKGRNASAVVTGLESRSASVASADAGQTSFDGRGGDVNDSDDVGGGGGGGGGGGDGDRIAADILLAEIGAAVFAHASPTGEPFAKQGAGLDFGGVCPAGDCNKISDSVRDPATIGPTAVPSFATDGGDGVGKVSGSVPVKGEATVDVANTDLECKERSPHKAERRPQHETNNEALTSLLKRGFRPDQAEAAARAYGGADISDVEAMVAWIAEHCDVEGGVGNDGDAHLEDENGTAPGRQIAEDVDMAGTTEPRQSSRAGASDEGLSAPVPNLPSEGARGDTKKDRLYRALLAKGFTLAQVDAAVSAFGGTDRTRVDAVEAWIMEYGAEIQDHKSVGDNSGRSEQRDSVRKGEEHDRENDLLRQDAEKDRRARFWENERECDARFVQILVDWCIAEFVRQKTNHDDLDSGEDVTEESIRGDNTTLSTIHKFCLDAFGDLFEERVRRFIKVVEPGNPHLDGRTGMTIEWDGGRGKYKVGLDTKRAKASEVAFVKPENLESIEANKDEGKIKGKKKKGKKKKKTTSAERAERNHSVTIQKLHRGHDFVASIPSLDIDEIFAAGASGAAVCLTRIMDERERKARARREKKEIKKQKEAERTRIEEEAEKREWDEHMKKKRAERQDRQRRWEEQERERNEGQRIWEDLQREQRERDDDRARWEEDVRTRREESARFGTSSPRVYVHFGPEGFGLSFGGWNPFGFFDDDSDEAFFDFNNFNAEDFDEEAFYNDEQFEEACSLLGVSEGASAQDIKAAYRREALRFHPDKYNGPESADGMSKEEAEDHFKVLSNAHAYLMSNLERVS